MGVANKILLKGDADFDEAVCSAVIKPGSCLALASNGTVGLHGAAADAVRPLLRVADMNELEGKDDTDTWASGSRIQFFKPKTGATFMVQLANSQNAAIGSYLYPSANGEFSIVAGAKVAVVQCLEALNNASGSSALIKVEAL